MDAIPNPYSRHNTEYGDDVRKLTGTTYPAANALVSRLVDLHIVEEMTGYARNRRFRYAPYIALFTDSSPQERA